MNRLYIGSGVIGLIAFLVIWLVFGHFWVGAIVGILVALLSGGIAIGGRGNNRSGGI